MKRVWSAVIISLLPSLVLASMVVHEVKRNSDLERDLAYTILVRDKHQAWRDQGLEKVFPIEGDAEEYQITLKARKAGKLQDMFGLTLTIGKKDAIVVQVPLAEKTKWHNENEISVEFLLGKEWIDQAQLSIRCGQPHIETLYTIQLADYVSKPSKP